MLLAQWASQMKEPVRIEGTGHRKRAIVQRTISPACVIEFVPDQAKTKERIEIEARSKDVLKNWIGS